MPTANDVDPSGDARTFINRAASIKSELTPESASTLGVELVFDDPPRPGVYNLASGASVVKQDGRWGIFARSGSARLLRCGDSERLHESFISVNARIHPTASVDSSARIEAGAVIGPHCTIGADAHVGRGTQIGPGSRLDPGAFVGAHGSVGKETVIKEGATVGAGSVLGNRCIVGAGSTVTQATTLQSHDRVGPWHKADPGTSIAKRRLDGYAAQQLAHSVERVMGLDRD